MRLRSVRTGFRRPAVRNLTAAVCCCIASTAVAVGQAESRQEVREFRYPIYDEQRRMQSQIFGDSAAVLSNENISITNLRMELYNNGEVDVRIKAAECLYVAKAGIVVSDSDVCLERENLTINGCGFKWWAKRHLVRIYDKVSVTLKNARDWTGYGETRETGPGDPTVITSDHLVFDYEKRHGVFEKNVHVVDSEMTIDADEMTVIFREDNSAENITAVGNVCIRRKDDVATCNTALCETAEARILLSGNAQIQRGDELLSGDTITFLRRHDRVISEHGRLVVKEGKQLEIIGNESL